MRFLILALCLITLRAQASDNKAQARVFAGRLFSTPTDYNTEMSSQGLTDFSTIDKFGVEAAWNLSLIDVGLRFTHNSANDNLKTTNLPTTYYSVISQDVVQAVVRLPIIKETWFKIDAVGSYGASNTTITMNSPTQMGHLKHTGLSGFGDAPVYNYGGSVNIGLNGTYLFAEVGQESNKVKGFSRDGNVGTNIDSLDLSGPYWIVGIHYDGSMGKPNAGAKR